ncbi:hypothetical protein ASG31_08430 [Chryseobacterium sp. Leaf404]|uniref:DUF6046 domain-containing protein n=1 Tax=unclassified Chryseobacterium TaxID=2593645 RepID=UPI0006F4F93C|nr:MULTISPECIES: DUF6046 domain-containing protein [unclassified Chryseobacterium]KQT17427.1 hypothetical protein ASG31_08430 [Chryseobacterium sp. Leaf404]
MTPTTANVINLVDLYKEYFGRGSYVVNKNGETSPAEEIIYSGIARNERPRGTIHFSNRTGQPFNKIGKYGQDIWFPIELKGTKLVGDSLEPISIPIDICTVSVNLVSTIIRTPVTERIGTVKEIISHDDYKFTIRGFLTSKDRTVPEDQILNLKDLRNSTQEKTLHGGYPELFLDETCRIVISDVEFPEVQGKNHWIRPFTLTCESDFITDLEFI